MGSTAGVRVLHVDDDPDFADLAADFLERVDEEIVVETATDAGEALERLDAVAFDCVVSDYDMPGRNGIDLLECVRERDPDLPFVLFTGKGSEEVASDAISAGATDYLQKATGTDQYELLANRVRNAVEQYRASRRAIDLDRIRTLATEINQALVRADSRAEAETRICEVISDAEPYVFAWIGSVDAETDRIEPRESAGTDDGYLDDVTITVDDTARGQGPAGTAVREQRLAVSQCVAEDLGFEPWREAALERGYQAVASVPLEHDDTMYGVLTVYADRTGAFDDDERSLLGELGDDIAHALHSFDLQADLRDERQFIDQALDTLDDIFYVVGPDRTLRRWNDRLTAVTGYTDAEIAEMQMSDCFPADERDRVADALEATFTTGKNTVEAEILTADGERIPYEFTGDRLTGPDGELVGLIGTGRDITDRKRRERAFERLHDATRELMRATTVEEVAAVGSETAADVLDLEMNGIHRYDADEEALVPIAWADRSADVLGGTPPTLPVEGSLAGRVFQTREIQSYADVREAAETFNADTPFRSELYLPLGDHGVFVVSSTTAGAFDATDEALARVLAANIEAALDRVEQRATLRRERDSLDEFVSVVSHDLRNPLNVAVGRLDLARSECDSDFLDDVAEAHERMETLIDDLLTLAREGDRIRETEPVDLAALVDGCWETVGAADATLRVETDRRIRADPSRVRQLLENLFSNAVHHVGAGVTVTVGDCDGGFYVADDGPGIPEADRDRVFQSGYSTDDDGTGFGLDIVAEVADAHGWELHLTDSDSGGVRIEIGEVDFATDP